MTDDRVRLAIAHAALRDGQPVGRWEISARVATEAAPEQLDFERLLDRAHEPAVEVRARDATADFHRLGVTQRPTFVLENAGGDRAILSGLASLAPLIAVTDALLADELTQIFYAAHHGGPPPA